MNSFPHRKVFYVEVRREQCGYYMMRNTKESSSALMHTYPFDLDPPQRERFGLPSQIVYLLRENYAFPGQPRAIPIEHVHILMKHVGAPNDGEMNAVTCTDGAGAHRTYDGYI